LYFVRADALSLPFPDRLFDITFSFGVFSYTTNPERCFNEMSRVLKPSGMAGLWLYPKKSKIKGSIFNILHNSLLRIPNNFHPFFCYLLSPLLFIIPTKSGIHMLNAKWSECAEIIAVNLLPQNVIFFTEDTVMDWFKKEYHSFEIDIKNPITVYGFK
jgi:ubiquinone/menaquinone biosynthesis C-methylase UbiE